mmetsp:Transcript_315/g.705  ORF Transcript_315/g.705 Transcript_315/m.705 type:complete len:1221 (-) Transcript_315:492-4154(-)
MSTRLESNRDDSAIIRSPSQEAAHRLKLFWGKSRKFVRRNETSFQSTVSETIIFEPALPLTEEMENQGESDHVVPIRDDDDENPNDFVNKLRRKIPSFNSLLNANNSNANIDGENHSSRSGRRRMKKMFDSLKSHTSSKRERRNSDGQIRRDSNISLDLSLVSDSNATDRVNDGRPMQKQISFNLNNLQENDSKRSERSAHRLAKRRRSWIRKLKSQFGRKQRRHSEPIMTRGSNRSLAISIGNDSAATEKVNHVRPMQKQISFNLSNLHDSESRLSGRGHDSFHDSFKRKVSSTVRKVMRPFSRRRRELKSMQRNSVRMRRSSNGSISIRSSEFSGNSDQVENFDLSFSIMPRESMRNLMSQRNLNPNLLDEMDEEDKVGLLAQSRAPSFNIMLHANEFYSDSCTLVKRNTVRISWDDLAKNTKNNDDEEDEDDDDPDDYVRDLGGRMVSDMRFDRNSTSSESSNVFGLRGLRSRGSLLVRRPSKSRTGSNIGGVPLWSGTSTIEFNSCFDSFVLHEKTKDWLKSFKTCDPRNQILTFFNDVANEGATGDSVNFKRDHVSPLLKYLYRSSVFSVWRPTSLDAIRRMMLGEGVGKGLDIKGKSAKRGKLSAFVPFLQIFLEEDKEKVRTLHKDSRIRIFFNSERDRNLVVTNLNGLAKELEETVRAAKKILADKDTEYDDETIENAMSKMTLDMNDSTINTIDLYKASNKYGIEVQERLFWEGMVVRQDIFRKPGSKDDIGRTSMPSFQDMNFSSLRYPRNSVPGGHTRAVIMHYNPPGEEYNPMNPLNLVMAYEENDPGINRRRVIPVVSDFDCFIVGTRGVRYEEGVPEDQYKVLKWMVEQAEGVLSEPSTDSWTKRWLDVLKEAGTKGFHPKIPDGGYADPKTRFIFQHAINRLGVTGAVRHGAECFNYYFPQELDEEVLVISDELPEKYNRCNWTYVNQEELKDILKFKIDKGYTFPLNPKWVLCDQGWKEVYDKLKSSDAPNVQDSLGCFYPPESGITELIEKTYEKYPDGFKRMDKIKYMRQSYKVKGRSTRLSQNDGTIAMDLARQQLQQDSQLFSETEGTMAMDLAEQELKYYFVLQRAKNRMRAYLKMTALLNKVRAGKLSEDSKKPDPEEKEDESSLVEKETKEDTAIYPEHNTLSIRSGEIDVIEEGDEDEDVSESTNAEEIPTADDQLEEESVSVLGAIEDDEDSDHDLRDKREVNFKSSRMEKFESF